LRDHPLKRRTKLTIYQWLTKPGPHPYQGSSRYWTAETLALAGIAPWIPAFNIINIPKLYTVLTESDWGFSAERWFLVE
jgi:hypothetical protein